MKPLLFSLLILSALSVQAGITMISGTAYDVGKGSHSQDDVLYGTSSKNSDSQMCWAATSSNLIQHWQDSFGAAAGAPNGLEETSYILPSGTRYLKVFNYLWPNFYNEGGNLRAAVNWYFNGKTNSLLRPYAESAGFYSGKGVTVTYAPGDCYSLQELKNVLSTPFSQKGTAVYIGLGGTDSRGNDVQHAITCWGYETDSTGTLIALFISDSDDQQFGVRRVNVVEKDDMVYISSTFSQGYYSEEDGEYYINEVCYISTPGAGVKPDNTVLAPGSTELGGAVDITGQSFTSSTGFTAQAGSILAASGQGTVFSLGVDSGYAAGSGLTIASGGFVSLNGAEVSIRNFAQNGVRSGAEAYLMGGSILVTGNKGTGVLVGGVDTDPRTYLELSHNDSVVISHNRNGAAAVTAGALQMTEGGTALTLDKGEMRIDSNTYVSLSDNTKSTKGGAIYAGNIFSLSDNTQVDIANNTAAEGGAIYVKDEIFKTGSGSYFIAEASLSASGNGVLRITGNKSSQDSIVFHQAEKMSFERNHELVFSGNDACTSTSAEDGNVIFNAGGRLTGNSSGMYFPMNASVLEIAHNDSVLFENNKAKYDIYNEGTVYLSADANQTITFQHGFMNGEDKKGSSLGEVKTYLGLDSNHVRGAGHYIFADNSAKVTMTTRETTISSKGGMVLGSDRTLHITNAEMSASAFTLVSASLSLEDCHITRSLTVDFGFFEEGNSLTMTNVTANTGTALYMSLDLSTNDTSHQTGASELLTGTTVTLRDYLGNANDLDAFSTVILNVDGTLRRGVELIIDATDYAYREDILLEEYSLVRTEGNLLHYERKVYPASEWTNASGNGTWDTATNNWQSNDANVAYKDERDVLFTDAAAGSVQLVGDLAPYTVTVNNSEGFDYSFEGSGSLQGDLDLTKQGTGKLTVATANSYTGRTLVQEGTLVAANTKAFGSSTVQLDGGTLDLGGLAVKNSVAATAGTIQNAQNYKGELNVAGSVSLAGTTTANHLTLENGTLTGGNIHNTSVTIATGTVDSTISGNSSVKITGDATLNGNNSYQGRTTITGATVTVGNASALGKSTVALENGTLDLGGLAVGNTVTLGSGFRGGIINGEAFTGTLALNGGTLDLQQNLGGTLALNGGTVNLAGLGAMQVGTLTTSALTELNVGDLSALGVGTYTVLNFADASGANANHISLAGMENMTDLTYSMKLQDNALALVLSDFVPGSKLEFNGEDKLLDLVATPESIHVTGSRNTSIYGEGSIAGTCSLTKDGAGTFTVSTTNTYTGGTTINEGTLAAGADGAFGTGTINLLKGTLAVNGYNLAQNKLLFKDTANLAGGDGGRLKSLDLDTPGILDRDGTLLFGGSLKLSGNMKLAKLNAGMGNISGGSLEVQQEISAKAGTISANISGTAKFTKQGNGTVTLQGSNRWTGDTFLQGGRLVFAGATQLPGKLTTAAGTTLEVRQNTTLGALTLGGGTLAISGSASLSVTGTLILSKATALDIDGGLALTFGSLDNRSGQSLSDFFGLTDSDYTVTQTENSLVFSMHTPLTTYALPAEDTAEAAVPAEATAVEPVAPVNLALVPAPAAAISSLAHGTWGAARATRLFAKSVRGHEGADSVMLDDEGTRSAWFGTTGSYTRTHGKGDASGADADIFSGALGMQFNNNRGGHAGLAIGQSSGRISPMDGGSRVSQQTQHAALYATVTPVRTGKNTASIRAIAGYATTDSDTTQNGHTFSWSQQSAILDIRGMWEHKLGANTALYGYAGMEYLATDSGKTENGASGSVQNLQAEAGAGVSHTAGRLTLYADAAVSPSLVRHNPVAESDGRRGRVSNPGRTGIRANVGGNYRIDTHWNVYGGYSFEGASRETDHSMRAGVNYNF